MAENVQTTISPFNGEPVVKRTLPTDGQVEDIIQRSEAAFKKWRTTSIDERVRIAEKFTDLFVQQADEAAKELSVQMGRPLKQCCGEISGLEERARYMTRVAKESLSDLKIEDKAGFRRYIRKEAVGPVLVISAWNFPLMIQINAVLPAILAGNSVILKPAPQTPLSGERFASVFEAAGLPADVLQVVHTSTEQLERLVAHPKILFVAFTGSVANGHRVTQAASGSFKGLGLELGGKDPAYVRADANVKDSAVNLVDAAMFNSGQSCCAVERIYVHESVYDEFVKEFVEETKNYKLGDPSSQDTNLGPVVSVAAGERIRKQVADAVAAGAKSLIPAEHFSIPQHKSFVAPTVLVDVNHDMSVMKDETFGPVVGIMKVSSDDEAVKLMNDSEYGLTASVWTSAEPESLDLIPRIEAGTVFFNRADYLDPALPWGGVKDSGRGVTLSKLGFEQFIRVKGVHLKLAS